LSPEMSAIAVGLLSTIQIPKLEGEVAYDKNNNAYNTNFGVEISRNALEMAMEFGVPRKYIELINLYCNSEIDLGFDRVEKFGLLVEDYMDANKKKMSRYGKKLESVNESADALFNMYLGGPFQGRFKSVTKGATIAAWKMYLKKEDDEELSESTKALQGLYFAVLNCLQDVQKIEVIIGNSLLDVEVVNDSAIQKLNSVKPEDIDKLVAEKQKSSKKKKLAKIIADADEIKVVSKGSSSGSGTEKKANEEKKRESEEESFGL